MKTLGTFIASMALLQAASVKPVTFHREVLPVIQKNCQGCHCPGEVAPMAFHKYKETRPYAKAIKAAVAARKMPPWFAFGAMPHALDAIRPAPVVRFIEIGDSVKSLARR